MKANNNFKEDFKNDLKNNGNTLKDVFDIVNKYYYTNSNNLGTITKSILIINIDKLISMSGVKPKDNF